MSYVHTKYSWMEEEEIISLADTMELDEFTKEVVARLTSLIDYVNELTAEIAGLKETADPAEVKEAA